jgi:hypothetical protein
MSKQVGNKIIHLKKGCDVFFHSHTYSTGDLINQLTMVTNASYQ